MSMTMKELCYALGISETMGYRLKNQGMPTHSIEAAKKWRGRHLDAMRTKEYRADGNTGKRARSGAHGVPLRNKSMETVDDLTDELMRKFGSLPAMLCDPIGIAAVASDAGLQLSGRQVLRFTQSLFCYYKVLFSGLGADISIPDKLLVHPDNKRFDEISDEIENALRLIHE
jgi:hypothetical protein